MKNFFYVLIILLITLACNLGQSTPAQSPPEHIPTSLPVETEAPAQPASGISISANGTNFTVPQGLAGGAQVALIPESFMADDMPYWEVYPAHLQFDFTAYVLEGVQPFHQPRILIYPAPQFTAMNEGAAEMVTSLQTILASPQQPLPDRLPFLPLFNAAQVIHSNHQVLSFQNGSGIRFLTQYGQAPAPINNSELFYTFQGLTTDGAYYVSVILPVQIGFLPPNGNPDTPLPPRGVPFDWDNFENITAHFDLVKEKLNAAPPQEFLPSLTEMDAMMQSITAGIQ